MPRSVPATLMSGAPESGTRRFRVVSLDANEYWSIDIPGLTEEKARALQETLAPEFDFGAFVISPRDFMTRGFDRPSVELLAHCLRAGLAAGGMSHSDTAGAQSMLEDCEGWLAQPVG